MTPNPGCLPFVRVPTVPLRVRIVATARVAPELRCARARSTVAVVDMIHDPPPHVLPNPGRGMSVAGGVNVTQWWAVEARAIATGTEGRSSALHLLRAQTPPPHSPYAHSVETPVIPATIGENCHGATRTSGEADRAAQAAGDLPPGSARAEADAGVATVGARRWCTRSRLMITSTCARTALRRWTWSCSRIGRRVTCTPTPGPRV
jgi:hypothetical protein